MYITWTISNFHIWFFAFHHPSIQFLYTNCLYIYRYIYKCYICTGVVHGLFVCWKVFHYYDIPCLPPQHLSWLIFVMPCWLTDCQTTNACSYFIIWYLFCTHCYPLITSFILSIQGQLFCFIEFLPYIYFYIGIYICICV